MWYKFENGNPIWIPRIKKYQVALYDTDYCDGERYELKLVQIEKSRRCSNFYD